MTQERVEYSTLTMVEHKGHGMMPSSDLGTGSGQNLYWTLTRQARVKLIIGLEIPHLVRDGMVLIDDSDGERRPPIMVAESVVDPACQIAEVRPVLHGATSEMQEHNSFTLFDNLR